MNHVRKHPNSIQINGGDIACPQYSRVTLRRNTKSPRRGSAVTFYSLTTDKAALSIVLIEYHFSSGNEHFPLWNK